MATELPAIISIAVTAGTAAAGVVVFMYKTWFKARIDHASQRTLAEFKHHLDSLGEAARFDYQRQITDFNRYAEKRHECYAELWKLLRTAQGRIVELAETADQEFSYYDHTDVERLLLKTEIPSGKRSEIQEVWKSDRGLGIQMLNQVLASAALHEADRAYRIASNCFVENELYLSDPVNEAVRNCLLRLDTLLVLFSDPRHVTPAKASYEQHRATEAVQELRGVMREDLSIGTSAINSPNPSTAMLPLSAALNARTR